ncbi:MAG: hypothetical protein BGN92_07735 [Sphingobacteriales bacterium 41-5]|nr:MAG: hypothetical protein BGN92_07735 [Sphingobacteriales bacterium 41-5]
MIRLLLFCTIILLASNTADAQVPDFISVKKRSGVTVRNYYAGGWPITFKAKDGRIYEGPIKKIANDSLWVTFYNVNKMATIWNTYFYDTVEVYSIPFHYKEIDHIIIPNVRKKKGYLFTLGTMMQYGGFGYVVVNAVNSVYLKDSFTSKRNLTNVGIATATGLAGTLLKGRYGNPYRKTKRYKIVYVNMQ